MPFGIAFPWFSLNHNLNSSNNSVFLTILSGIIGIILGTLILYGINVATEDLSDFPYTNPTVPLKFIFGALALMIILGTLIGMLPAQKAVSIKPIDALREE